MGIKIPDQVVSAPSSTRPAQDRDLKDIGQQALTGTNALNIALQARPDFEALQRTVELGGEVIQGVEDARIERENIKDAKKLSLDAIEHISEQSGIPHTYESLKKANSDWRKKQEIDYKKKYKNDKKGLMEFENKYQTDILLKHESDSVSTYFRKQAIGSIDTYKEVFSLYFDTVSNSENTEALLFQEFKIALEVLRIAHAREKGITDVNNPDHAVNEAELKKFAWIRGLENTTAATTINGEKNYSVIQDRINDSDYNWEKEHGWKLDEKEKLVYKKEINNRVKEQNARIETFKNKKNLSNFEEITTKAQAIYNNDKLTKDEKDIKFAELKEKAKIMEFYGPEGKTLQNTMGNIVDNVAIGGKDTNYNLYTEIINGIKTGKYTSMTDKIQFGGKNVPIINLVGSVISFEDHKNLKQIFNDPNLREKIANDLKLIDTLADGILEANAFNSYKAKDIILRKSSLKGILRKKIQEYLKENPDLKVSDVIAPQILKDGEIINNPDYIDKNGSLSKAFEFALQDYIKEKTSGLELSQTGVYAETREQKTRDQVIQTRVKPGVGFSTQKHTVYVIDPKGKTIPKDAIVDKFINSVKDSKGKSLPIVQWSDKDKKDAANALKKQITNSVALRGNKITPGQILIIVNDILIEAGLEELKD